MLYSLLPIAFLLGLWLLCCITMGVVIAVTLRRNVESLGTVCIVLSTIVTIALAWPPIPVLAHLLLHYAYFVLIIVWCITKVKVNKESKQRKLEPPKPPVIFRLAAYRPGEEDQDVYASPDSATPPR